MGAALRFAAASGAQDHLLTITVRGVRAARRAFWWRRPAAWHPTAMFFFTAHRAAEGASVDVAGRASRRAPTEPCHCRRLADLAAANSSQIGVDGDRLRIEQEILQHLGRRLVVGIVVLLSRGVLVRVCPVVGARRCFLGILSSGLFF